MQYDNSSLPPPAKYNVLKVGNNNENAVCNLVFEYESLSSNNQSSNAHLYYTFNGGNDKWSKYQLIPNENDFTKLKDTVDNLAEKLGSIAFNMCYPVYCTYIQLPGHMEPKKLFGLGTWLDITSRYQGAFFRAYQDGVSEPFTNSMNGGVYTYLQKASLPNITGGFYAQQMGGGATAYGAFYHRDGKDKVDSGFSQSAKYLNYIGFSASEYDASKDKYGDNVYKSKAEVKPKNYSIKIWERTA